MLFRYCWRDKIPVGAHDTVYSKLLQEVCIIRDGTV